MFRKITLFPEFKLNDS
uniref:Uncharacterized protein n=1 Tax=Anguilla anguilla TaxID=7936 RepID=A0A0E9S1V4_ANGAN